MVKQTLAMLVAGLAVIGCNSADSPPAEKKEMKSPATQPAKADAAKADAAKAAAPIRYAELKQGDSTWVVGTADGAAAVKAGKKPAHVMSITGGKKVYFEQDKDGKLAGALMAQYDQRHGMRK